MQGELAFLEAMLLPVLAAWELVVVLVSQFEVAWEPLEELASEHLVA